MDLIDDPQPGENAHDYTVSEISGALKRVIEGEFGRVRVRGEVGRVFAARSGHLYFDLKDDRSVLAAVTWKGQLDQLRVKPEEGMEVVATGRLTTFPSQSKYQLNVDDIRPAGVGALMAMLEKRKAQLQAEGLFAAERKKPIPFLPQVIGVVTSPGGAVIRDILHRLRDRFPRHVLVWPVAVQGEKCAPEVAAAIAGFNRLGPDGPIPRPDLIIVARGGGSIEDLWGFNEEIVARAAAASEIPLISAVGHETDTTLIDYVSDYRAPTPTAAAERAVPVRRDLLAWLAEQDARLIRAVGQGVTRRRQRVGDLSRALPRPESLLASARQRLDAADRALPLLLRGLTRAKAHKLTELSGALRPAVLRARIGREKAALGQWSDRHAPALVRLLAAKRRDLAKTAGRLDPARLSRRAVKERADLDAATARLAANGRTRLDALLARLDALDRTRRTLGYEATLARGYALVWDDGRLVPGMAEIAGATALEVQFRDGRVPVVVGGGKPATKAKPGPEAPDQGSLF
jgi:exodeoxyribonuclease VII large subunit